MTEERQLQPEAFAGGTNQNPTVADNKSSDDSGTGSFTSSVAGLTPGTIYYFRVYATNSIGTVYGNQVTATTTAGLSTLITADVSNFTATSITSGGNITFNGGAPVTARGICWSTTQNPTIANNITSDGTGSGSFTSTITGLTPAVAYYFRAYATNSIGTSYGNELGRTTPGGVPGVSADSITSVSSTGAILGGIVDANYLSTTVSFEYGLTTSYGNIAIASQSPITEAAHVSAEITGLTANTTYHYRMVATNSIGTTFGTDKTFKTAP